MTLFFQSILRWAPRALAILEGIFLLVFAFDEPFGLGFLLHLLPGFFVLGGVALVWNRSFAGGLLFFILAIASVFFFHTYETESSFLLISFPLLMVSALFFFSAFIRMREID